MCLSAAFLSFWQAKFVRVLLLQVPHASVNHVPTLTGGKGHEELRKFYSQHFIPAFPGVHFWNFRSLPKQHVLLSYSCAYKSRAAHSSHTCAFRTLTEMLVTQTETAVAASECAAAF